MPKQTEYVEPEVDISESYNLYKKTVPGKDYLDVYTNLLDYMKKCDKEEILSGTNYKKYAFSIYTQLDIPSYSMIYTKAFRPLEKAFLLVGDSSSENSINTSPLGKFFGVPSLFYKEESQAYNLFMRVNGYAKKVKLPAYKEYKIHLCVKEQYCFYAFLKLALVVYPFFNSLLPDNSMELKWNLQSRFDRISSKDTVVLESNGGPTASIVFYTSTADPDIVRRYLQLIVKGFPEETSIGLMSVEGGFMPFGNVRVNHMLCYAQGDRGIKLKQRKSNISKDKTLRQSKSIPAWLKKLQTNCSSNKTKAVTKSKRYLGINACSNPVDETCTESYCYLGDPLDPESIMPKI
jgi:hypothetical protein